LFAAGEEYVEGVDDHPDLVDLLAVSADDAKDNRCACR
jgi:hypothetical protein